MKLNLAERLMTNSPLRAFSLRHFEGPALRRMAACESYGYCLEIGCGRGVGAETIVRLFDAHRVEAIDIDPLQIARAEKRLSPSLRERISFAVGDAMALEFEDNTFDAVFSFGVIHHMEDWRAALAEISRVLKSGGELFYLELLRSFLTRPHVRLLTEHPEGGLFTADEFRSELEGLGLHPSGFRQMGKKLIAGAAVKQE